MKTFHVKLIDLSLDRVLRLLDKLGNPHERLAPVVHVAGTNGKGSTIAFLRAVLEAAGNRVHVYTSPHLVRFNERIRLAGAIVDEVALMAILEEVEAVNAGAPITFFEITTAVAFLAMARSPADITLLETGLGGRFDATNVVAAPVATVITPVSLDHQHFLGDTVAAIAGEKAGILKRGAPAVLAPQAADAEAVLEAQAAAVGAPLFRFGREWLAFPMAAGPLRYESDRWRLDLPAPSLLGRHQYDNAATAIACIEQLGGFGVDMKALAEGLVGARWPARLQRLSRGPLVASLAAGAELWIDGGHNEAGGAALAAVAEAWADRPLRIVFGMLNTHDAKAFLRHLAAFASRLDAVAIPGEDNSLSAEESADAARAVGIVADAAGSIGDAVARRGTPGERVLICGSLYLAGHVLATNE